MATYGEAVGRGRLVQLTRQSAYGLTFRGIPLIPELDSIEVPISEPEVTIRTESGDRPLPALRMVDSLGGVRRLADGRVLAVDRTQATATFFGPPISADLLPHPYLAPVATTFSRWAGREVFHAGAFVVADRAWAAVGPRTAGKSTLIAALAARSVPVLTDDVLVSDGDVAFPGPRCIDLREPLPSGSLHLLPTRRDTRWRVRLPGGTGPVPLGGWLFLHWGTELDARAVGPRQLIGRLAAARAWRHLRSDPATMLALATLPAWDLTRPRDWDALDASVDLITAIVARARASSSSTAARR